MRKFLSVLALLSLPVLIRADVSNFATVTYKDSAGTSHSANSNTVTVTVNPLPVITLTKTSDVSQAVSGQTVTFTISYSNTTSGVASSTLLTDVVPSGMTLVPGSVSNGGTVAGSSVTWNFGTVSGSQTGSVFFKATVN